MTFYVEKKLALGSIGFGVAAGGGEKAVDDDPALNTGPVGEFVQRREAGFFFGGRDRFAAPTLPPARGISSTPFWSSLKPDRTPRGYGFLALLAFGALLVLLGLGVVARKGPQGWIEVILGAGMIATPIVLTAQKRKKIREQEERDRAEREAAEKFNREMLVSYTGALERARLQPDEAAFAHLELERQELTLPYEIWGPMARRTVLLIGFDELARRGPAAAREIAERMDRVSRAAGLTPEDQKGVKLDLFRTVLWHFLADDRLGKSQEQQLRLLRDGFGIEDESKVTAEFRRLQDLSTQKPPRANCSKQLGFNEYCIYQAETDQGTLHVTNKRVIIDGKKRFEMPVTQVFDVTVRPDENTVSVKTGDKPFQFRVEDPIYTAAILDLASQIDERPRGFA